MNRVKEPENFDETAFIAKAKAIYNEKYKAALEKSSKGQVAAIEVESGDCFVGESKKIAYYKAKEVHFNKFFFFIKIGYLGFKRRRM